MANSNNNFSISGLTSGLAIVSNAGYYQLKAEILLPMVSSDAGWSVSQPTPPAAALSQVVAVVSQNGSPIYTSTAGVNEFQTNLTAAAGDIISVALSSSAPVDQPANTIRATISIA